MSNEVSGFKKKAHKSVSEPPVEISDPPDIHAYTTENTQ
jgi:hypothetical protein